MTDPDLIRLFIEPLERLEIPYMITGGVAAVIYGDPRFTRGVDVVLKLSTFDARRLDAAFSRKDFYVPPLEVLEAQASRARGGHFNLIHHETALRADVYVTGDDPLHAWALERRRRLPLDEMSIWVAPLEYVILRKLEYFNASGSDRHLRDVAVMLQVSGELLDRPAFDRWSSQLGLAVALERARAYRTDT